MKKILFFILIFFSLNTIAQKAAFNENSVTYLGSTYKVGIEGAFDNKEITGVDAQPNDKALQNDKTQQSAGAPPPPPPSPQTKEAIADATPETISNNIKTSAKNKTDNHLTKKKY